MKTLAIITLFATANLGTTLFASTNEKPTANYTVTSGVTEHAKRLEAFKSQVAFHQYNVEVLWNQYDLAMQSIRNSAGNHADLEREQAFFVGLYQKDVDNNIRVEESKVAITEINAKYAKAHKARSAEEALRIAALQKQLKVALNREAKALKKTKQANAALIAELPLFMEVEYYITESIRRADMLLADNNDTVAAVR